MTAERTSLTPAEASQTILAELRPLPPERVPILEARGRILAQVVTSPMDVPPWDNSSMDGYAVRAADLRSGKRVLRVVEEVAAGSFPTRPIDSGECARVFTGAPIPNGADSVIRQEHTTRLDSTRVQIDDLSDADRNVRRRGEDITRGSVVLEPGAEIGAAQIGLLASLAQRDVHVHGRPRVAILSSGDEIVDLDQPELIVSGRKIASSNSYTMIAMTLAAGAEPLSLGIAADEPGVLRQRLQDAATADLIVTSGAMSVGAHDHLRAILESGTIVRFWRLKTRPGAPVGFGIVHGTPWIGLPGNPVSTMVSFEMFVRPAIRRLLGHRKLFRRARRVRVGESISTPPKLTHFLRVRLAEADEGNVLVARPTGPQGSHILTSMAEADALLIVPEEVDRLEVGDEATAILLRDSEFVEEMPY